MRPRRYRRSSAWPLPPAPARCVHVRRVHVRLYAHRAHARTPLHCCTLSLVPTLLCLPCCSYTDVPTPVYRRAHAPTSVCTSTRARLSQPSHAQYKRTCPHAQTYAQAANLDDSVLNRKARRLECAVPVTGYRVSQAVHPRTRSRYNFLAVVHHS